MAKTKLTVSVDEQVVANAKRLAATGGTSLAAMIERLLRAVTAEPEQTRLGPLTKRALGIAKVPNKPVQDLLADALWVRYGSK
jgi:hypothetical protein